MHSYYYSSLLTEMAPGLTIIIVGIAAAIPPYRIMRKSRRGRARSSIAYILGFFAGLAMTALLASTIAAPLADRSAVHAAGMLAAFFAPFGGMLRARLRRPTRRQQHGPALARN